MCDGFVNLRFGATGSNTTDGLAVHLDGQSALVGEKVRKSEDIEMALFQCLGAVFRRTLVERSVARFLLGEFDGVERGGIRFLQKKQMAAFVDDADSHFNIQLFSFRFSGRDHRFDCRQVHKFPGGQIG